MGKSTSAKMPTYDRAAAQEEQRWAAEQARKYTQVGVEGPYGGYEWYTDPQTGLQTVRATAADTDVQRSALGSTMLSRFDPNSITGAYEGVRDFNLDPTAASDAYFNASTRYLTQDYQKQRDRLSADLVAKGVPIGSQAYNDAMAEADDAYNRAVQTAADTAVSAGQQYQTTALQNELARAGALAGASQTNLSLANALTQAQYDPLARMVQGAGGQFGGTYDAEFAAKTAAAEAKNKRRSAIGSAIGSALGTAAGAIGGAYLGGPTGAMAGAKAGSSLGSSIGSAF